MARIYISIGSNIDAEKNIRGAVQALCEQFDTLLISSVYESEAVGFEGDKFLNLVVGADTDASVRDVSEVLHRIEDQFGRERSGPKFSSRTLDLDLLLYDDMVLHEDGIQIPRDEITQNAFVLWPLAELVPQQCHPESGVSFAKLWEDYDKSRQQLTPIEFDWQA
jgi:2-amino-4-hydroxy-6-hydroxymethyldihydropteridine diphosphokinase